ncbi:type I-F CRISPR-associated protein Csy2 [Psychromonas hadalis]|uniref:type I-F CRISPR-associated protein Csy2 n=1 Tax=Psychromonas hadalis TaxID=211669 RepID=UPI0003B49BB3|nr:type I-F CRISPR-associated protein Csy2 [Psychromonas hadalis]
MVNILHIKELLNDTDIALRDVALRHAFSSFTEPVDITGCENSALIILLNLTYPRKKVDDLLNKKLAKKTLNNEVHIENCLGEVQWLHSHNLKYPDIRVSKQRLLVALPVLHRSVLSSANFEACLGWSHDSAKVNFAKLFDCHFVWQGKKSCLARLLVEEQAKWKVVFQSLGMPVKDYLNLSARINSFLPECSQPEIVDRHSPQIRLPYHDGYTALTPVISHAVQSEIQQASRQRRGKFTHVEFTRPAAVSDLVSSIGGNVCVLDYPPPINKTVHGLTHSRLFRVLNGESVLNIHALVRSQFRDGITGFLSIGNALALKQRREQKVTSIKQIRAGLAEWLAPLIEWRLEVKDNGRGLVQLESCKGSLEYQFLTVTDDQLAELTVPLFSLLNTTLSNLSAMEKYAFHQQLMPVLKNHLKWLLTHIADEDKQFYSDAENNRSRYLYLKGLRVFDAQALSNPYCCGTPSLTAVWGMIHRYQRKLNEALGATIRLTSFSWFIKEFSYVTGKKLPEKTMQGPKQNQFRRPSIIDNKHCDLVFDLVVHIDGYEEELLLLDSQQALLKACFPANFAGGVMHQPELSEGNDWCDLYSSEVLLYKKLSRLPMSGRWIMPTKHKVSSVKELIELLKKHTSLYPTMFGYLLLGTPQKRTGSLGRLHCYAEPTIGVAEYVSPIDIRLQGIKNYFNKSFWMLDAQECSMLMKRV